jgi:hypothetical protein
VRFLIPLDARDAERAASLADLGRLHGELCDQAWTWSSPSDDTRRIVAERQQRHDCGRGTAPVVATDFGA